jgi:hypothetical protein
MAESWRTLSINYRIYGSHPGPVIITNNYKKCILKDPNITDDACRKCQEKSETIQDITGA